MSAYYNEIDPFAAAWLRELIAGGHIAPGDVDERSIADVSPDDLVGYDQCHFFAGIGGWSLALRLAGVPDDARVWTGSCPCQPFSVAGLGRGTDDERHIWPEFRRLIAERAPPVVFGEQVASGAGRGWLAAVRADLEDLAYGVGAADLCAAGVGAPHIRQRLWWGAVRVADAGCLGIRGAGSGAPASSTCGTRGDQGERKRVRVDAGPGGAVAGGPANAYRERGRQGGAHAGGRDARGDAEPRPRPSGDRSVVGLAHPDDARPQGRVSGRDGAAERAARPGGVGGKGGGSAHGGWAAADWLGCRDGKWRPVEPGSSALVDGVPARVGRLRGYGNAIVPPVAAAFVSAFLDSV